MRVDPAYEPRHITQDQLTELTNLWWLARCALAGGNASRHNRMLWASKEFAKLYPEISEIAAYKDLSNSLWNC